MAITVDIRTVKDATAFPQNCSAIFVIKAFQDGVPLGGHVVGSRLTVGGLPGPWSNVATQADGKRYHVLTGGAGAETTVIADASAEPSGAGATDTMTVGWRVAAGAVCPNYVGAAPTLTAVSNDTTLINGVQLDWSAAVTCDPDVKVTVYNVFKSTAAGGPAGGPWTAVATNLPPTTLSKVIGGLTNGQRTYFRLETKTDLLEAGVQYAYADAVPGESPPVPPPQKFSKIRLGDGLTGTDEGGGVVRIDSSGGGGGGGGIDFDQSNTGGYLRIDASADVAISGGDGVGLTSAAGTPVQLWSGGDIDINANAGHVNIWAEGADNAANLTSDGGVAAVDGNKGVELWLRTGGLKIATLPTADPGVADNVWADDGTLVLSGYTAGGDGSGGITSIGDTTPSSLTGLLKGNGTDIDVAVAGTDYATPAQVSAKVDRDAVEAATNRLVAVKLAAGDAQPSFLIRGNGQHEWGPGGGGAADVLLWRNGPRELRTNGYIEAQDRIYASIGSAQVSSFGAFAGVASVVFGDAEDTRLSRLAAHVVKVDDQLVAANAITIGTSAGAPTDGYTWQALNGSMVLDSTNHRLYVRSGGVWKYTQLT